MDGNDIDGTMVVRTILLDNGVLTDELAEDLLKGNIPWKKFKPATLCLIIEETASQRIIDIATAKLLARRMGVKSILDLMKETKIPLLQQKLAEKLCKMPLSPKLVIKVIEFLDQEKMLKACDGLLASGVRENRFKFFIRADAALVEKFSKKVSLLERALQYKYAELDRNLEESFREANSQLISH